MTGAGHSRPVSSSRFVSQALLAAGAGVAALAVGAPVTATAIPTTGKASRPPGLSYTSAAGFLLGSIEDKVDGDWARAWESLYPLHRRIAPRDAFIRCESATPFPARMESLHVVDVSAAAVRVPGLRHDVPGVAIEVKVELAWYGPRDPIVFRHTFHLIPVRGGWTWLLSPSRYRLYERGACSTRHGRLEAAAGSRPLDQSRARDSTRRRAPTRTPARGGSMLHSDSDAVRQ